MARVLLIYGKMFIESKLAFEHHSTVDMKDQFNYVQGDRKTMIA